MEFRLELVNDYINEYITIGKNLGYFGDLQSIRIRKKLTNIEVIEDNNLVGDAFAECINGIHKLYINTNRLKRKDERFTSEVLFHEFTHMICDIHIDLFEKKEENSLIRNYKKTFIETMKYYFKRDYTNTQYNNPSIYSPYTYTLHGAALLNEAIAQNVAEDFLSYKYNTNRIKRKEYSKYADITYTTDFQIYGIYQELANRFVNTIRGYNNLREFSIASLKENFVNNLISDHIDNAYTYEMLYKKLSYLGVIYFKEEVKNGHLKNVENPNVFNVYETNNLYKEVLKICDEGYDNRPTPFYKKILVKDNIITWE